MLPVVARPEVADDLTGLSPALLRAVRRLLPALKDDPLGRSLPLDYDSRIGNLGDCRKVYFDESAATRPTGYRIVLRLLPDEEAPERIQIVSIGREPISRPTRRAAARLMR